MSNLKLNQGMIDQAVNERTEAAHERLDISMRTLLREIKEAIQGLDSIPQNSNDLLAKSLVAFVRTVKPFQSMAYPVESEIGLQLRIAGSYFELAPEVRSFSVAKVESGKAYRALFFLLPIDE